MQIEIKLDESCKEPKIIIHTDKMTEEVSQIVKLLSEEKPEVFAAIHENGEYYGAAEPPVRCGESHLSGLTEPLRSL